MHRSGAPKTLEVARATILNILMHLFQANFPFPMWKQWGPWRSRKTLEMHDNLGDSMPTLDFNANLEDLNFAKINALFFLMETLNFRTGAPSGGEVQPQTPTYAPATPWKIARAHSRPKRVFAAQRCTEAVHQKLWRSRERRF